MRLTPSSIFMTVLISTVMISLLHVILTHSGSHRLFRSDFLRIFTGCTVLRLVFPVEFPFTITIISLKDMMNPFMDVIYGRNTGYDLRNLIFVIWLIGLVCCLSVFLFRYFKAEQAFKEVVRTGTVNNTPVPVCCDSIIKEPMVFSFHRIILMPEISYTGHEIDYILDHEQTHIQYHDGLKTAMMHVLCAIYWWFPMVWLLKKDFRLFQEIRTDDVVCRKMDDQQLLDYASALVEIRQKTSDHDHMEFTVCVVGESDRILENRIDYLILGTYRRKTPTMVLAAVMIVPWLCNAVILEPHYDEILNQKEMYSEAQMMDGVLIQRKDGIMVYRKDGIEYVVKDPSWEVFDGLEVIEE